MASQTRPIETRRYPWARGGFDLEGWVAAIAALVVGLLLGWIWSPLFLLGLGAAVLALLASRHSPRLAPVSDEFIVAPVDAVVHSVRESVPPKELGLPSEIALRVRLSSAPYVQNRVLAPASGTIAALQHDAGRQGVIIAPDPETDGLERVFLTIAGDKMTVGCDIKVAGFGPRLDPDIRESDAVSVGDVVGKRRLGGWCDVWLPEGTRALVRPGQSVLAGETVLVSAASAVSSVSADDDEEDDEDDIDELEAATADMFNRLRTEVAGSTSRVTGQDGEDDDGKPQGS
jgi:phosphatidylserine decarboxylase